MTRPVVAWFAEAMEKKLQANEHKPDWQDRDTEYLLRRLLEEVLELHQAYLHASDGSAWVNAEAVLEEAADVANFAMMIADRSNGMFAQRGRAAR